MTRMYVTSMAPSHRCTTQTYPHLQAGFGLYQKITGGGGGVHLIFIKRRTPVERGRERVGSCFVVNAQNAKLWGLPTRRSQAW